MADGSTPGGGWVPVPDPTTLTAEAVASAEVGLRREIANIRAILEARMDSMDNERRLLLQIMDERTGEVNRRFRERDIRYGERDLARKEAVEVALEAAKEAVRTALDAARELNAAHDAATEQASQKFEAAIREQIQQTAVLFQAGRERLDAKIEALKERMDRGEGGTAGAGNYRTERRLDLAQVIAVVSVIVAIIAVVVLIFKH